MLMGKKIIILAVFLVATSLIVAGCGKQSEDQDQGQNRGQGQNQDQQQQEEGEGQEEEEQTSVQGTFQEVLKLGTRLKCDFSSETEDGTISGTAYTDGSQMRQESTLEQGEERIESNVIVKNEEVYAWSSVQPGQGMKVSLADVESRQEEQTSEQEEADMSPGMEQSFEYSCEKWNVDESKFQLPQDIDFQDMSSMLEAVQSLEGDARPGTAAPEAIEGADREDLNQQACQACQYSPDAEQCRQRLNCQ